MEKTRSKNVTHIRFNRRRTYLLLLLCFLFPVFLTTSCALSHKDVFMIAALSSILCGIGGYYILNLWEQRLKVAVAKLVEDKCENMHVMPSDQIKRVQREFERARLGYEHQIDLLNSSVQKSKEQVNELNLEMDKKLEQMRVAYLEFEDLRKEYTRLQEEYERYQAEVQGQLKHKESLLTDYQQTICEQRKIIEKKQHYIEKLEGKVRDLMYEIRSLLRIEDPLLEPIPVEKDEEPLAQPMGQQPYDHSVQLGRYLEMAEKFMGADHLGGRFLDSSANRYAIDLRPLYDRLRDESHGVVFVYSQFESKFLFVNKMIKNLLGLSGEKFMKEFPNLVVEGQKQWDQALLEVAKGGKKQLSLVLKTKQGDARCFECYMGVITKGPFVNYVIGMMITSYTSSQVV